MTSYAVQCFYFTVGPLLEKPTERRHYLDDLSLFGTHFEGNDWLWLSEYIKYVSPKIWCVNILEQKEQMFCVLQVHWSNGNHGGSTGY